MKWCMEKIHKFAGHLKLTHLCIFKAIGLARTFLMENSQKKFDFEFICLAAIVFVCDEIPLRPEDIYAHACKVFRFSNDKLRSDICIFQQHLVDYKNHLIAYLRSKNIVWDPLKCIGDIVATIPDGTLILGEKYCILTKERKCELARLARLLVNGSIAIKPICINYTPAVIGRFCVEMAIKVQEYEFATDIWSKDKKAGKQVQNVMNQYSKIFQRFPDRFQSEFGNEHVLYDKIKQITSTHVASLKNKSITKPSSSVDNMIESNSVILSTACSGANGNNRLLNTISVPVPMHEGIQRDKPETQPIRTKRSGDFSNDVRDVNRSNNCQRQ